MRLQLLQQAEGTEKLVQKVLYWEKLTEDPVMFPDVSQGTGSES